MLIYISTVNNFKPPTHARLLTRDNQINHNVNVKIVKLLILK